MLKEPVPLPARKDKINFFAPAHQSNLAAMTCFRSIRFLSTGINFGQWGESVERGSWSLLEIKVRGNVISFSGFVVVVVCLFFNVLEYDRTNA